MNLHKPDSALVIIGHGSTLNPDSSGPTFQHADAIRALGCFAEVHAAFWKEQPGMREILYGVDSQDIYLVPLFISEGYFTQEVIPREFGLSGPVTEENGRILKYCLPVGIHSTMTDLLLKRAEEVAPGIPKEDTTLIIVGHGTQLNDQSTKAIKDQVRFIHMREPSYGAVLDAYMEEPPLIANWAEFTKTKYVVVVPFFIADGLHSYEEIPVMLGVESEPMGAASEQEVFRRNPYLIGGHELYYSRAIGTEETMSRVILEQVRDFDDQYLLSTVS